jgi:peptide chain release factor 1
VALRIKGKGAAQIFANEAGGHRFQRVPPNERNGRVHTSTITVATLPEPQEHELRLDERDLEWKTRRGSGPGGQHRNKTESCVDLTHKPTGIKVTADSRSQHENKVAALQILRAKLLELQRNKATADRNSVRQDQIGCGMRGDKRRTIRVQDNMVTDHILNQTMPYNDYERGNWKWS